MNRIYSSVDRHSQISILFFSSLQRNPRAKKSSVPNIDIYSTTISPNDLKATAIPKQILSRKTSEPDIHYGTNTLGELVCCFIGSLETWF